MESNKLIAAFGQYQQLSSEEERQDFWVELEQKAKSLTPDQRQAEQIEVRQNIDQILQRMEAIVDQLKTPEPSLV